MPDSHLWRHRDHLHALPFTEEAEEKWRRRAARINWNNIIYKFSEMNGCTAADLKAFDALPAARKVVFTHKDYGLKNQVIYTEFNSKPPIQRKVG